MPAVARRVDALFVMTYDMVTNGFASANAPLASPTLGLSDVQALIAYSKVVPPAKLILGIPFYGYDFTTTSKTPGARSVGAAESVSVVVAVGRPALWDVGSETPFSVFQRAGTWHQTWFEDPVSVALKTALASVLHLGGIGVWSLGQEGDETALLRRSTVAQLLRAEIPTLAGTQEATGPTDRWPPEQLSYLAPSVALPSL